MELVKPAQLSFLTLYNPSLGRSDETLHDQVLFYHSARSQKSKKTPGQSTEAIEDAAREERNERLRQIGLAQGMVEFAKSFSDGEAVDAIDSERSRIVLHELEPGWWILGSVELSHLRNTPGHSRSKSDAAVESQDEYSSRDIAPQTLLLQNLLRAHEIFLLHHASSLADLYVRVSRPRLCLLLERYWNRFIRDWDVFLSGNPAVDIFNGLKLAAGGELGMGVGEEEWGSGEREVLEGFVGRTEGLVDMVVSRFGDASDAPDQPKNDGAPSTSPWLGQGLVPEASDGVVFSGVGAVTRPSVKVISAWMEQIYRYGVSAYGIGENPQSTRKKRRRRADAERAGSGTATPTFATHRRGRSSGAAISQPRSRDADSTPGIPPPIVQAAKASLKSATAKADQAKPSTEGSSDEPTQQADMGDDASKPPAAAFDSETVLKYMTLGVYGSSWGIPARGRASSSSAATPARSRSAAGVRSPPPDDPLPPPLLRLLAPRPQVEPDDEARRLDVEGGCFLVGLQGDLSLEDDAPEEEEPGTASNTDEASAPKPEASWNRRIVVRALHAERHGSGKLPTFSDRHRAVVYARRPFLFVFVFDAKTPTLSYTGLYRALHHQLGPLRRPLVRSTEPSNAAARLADALHSARAAKPTAPPTPDSEHPLFALLYDPATQAVLASLPNIPEPSAPAAEGFWGRGGSPARTGLPWTRADALATHALVVSVAAAAQARPAEAERVALTGRGWWVAWLRLPAAEAEGGASEGGGGQVAEGGSRRRREAFLVRRALDPGAGQAPAKKGFGFGSPGRNASAREGMGRIVEGLGVDARRYVEGLLSLNR